MLMAGSATLVLRQNGRDESAALDTSGQYIIVPRGCMAYSERSKQRNHAVHNTRYDTQNLEQPPED